MLPDLHTPLPLVRVRSGELPGVDCKRRTAFHFPMKLRQPFQSESPPAEQSTEIAADPAATDVARAAALEEARALDAANYVRRYAQFAREVKRLKFGDAVAGMAFPAAAYVMALFVLVRALGWLVEHSGGEQSSFAQSAFFILIFGVIGLTAGASWVADRERRARLQDQGKRIQEIASRYGVEPGRPRMDGESDER